MAYGQELFLGVMGMPAIAQAIDGVGLAWTDDDGFLPESREKEIQAGLKDAQKAALEELGLKLIEPEQIKGGDKLDRGYFYVQGPDGVVRQTCIWGLELHYDPDECGDTEETAVCGVSLISRYFPVFLDWDKKHGGSGDPISLTPDALRQIEVARKHISKVLPFIGHAPITIKEKHY